MKWGQMIKENTLWKWKTCYISYDVMKQIIKSISNTTPHAPTQTITELKLQFAIILETDVFKVESFFEHQQNILSEQYDLLLIHRNNKMKHISHCIKDGLHKLLTQLKELQHYAYINAEGFRKIVKKYDKRMQTNIGTKYYASLEEYKFYQQLQIKQMIENISDLTNNNNKADGKIQHVIERNIESQQMHKISQLFTRSIRSNNYDAIESIINYLNVQTLQNLINSVGFVGNTALMTCCAVSGSIEIAQLLIKHGADISICNNYYRNALHLASRKGDNELIALLLRIMNERKERHLIHELDVDLNNVLHLACLRQEYVSCRELIAFDSSIVNIANADGATPLMLVCNCENNNDCDEMQLQQTMEMLLKYCTNINQRDWNLQSALHYACKSGNKTCVEILCKHADLNLFVFNCYGESALHVAAENGHLNILKRIVYECDQSEINNILNNVDENGRSALHLCAANGYKECTKYLLSIGANADILDCNMCNAHSYALFNGNLNEDQCVEQSIEERKELSEKKLYSTKRRRRKTTLNLIKPRAALIGSHECVVRFRIQCYANDIDYICIVGDCAALGDFDVRKSVKMYRNRMPLVIDDVYESDEDINTPRIYSKLQNDDLTTWIAEILLAKGVEIQYRYIIRRESSFTSLSPFNRSAIIRESIIIDDGVFGVRVAKKSKSTHAIPRHGSIPESLSKVTEEEEEEEKESDYIQAGWLVNDAQLQIHLGHNYRAAAAQQRDALVINYNIHIDHIVIHSGSINKNRSRGICIKIEDVNNFEKVYKFQSNRQQISALCSLEFEFFARFGDDAISRIFVLSSQILSAASNNNALSLPLSTASGLLIGEFNFEFLLILPFSEAARGSILFPVRRFKHQHAYNRAIIIGHRGTGSHKSAHLADRPRRTHIKENTILAFNTAHTFGADCVEFDVQLTKDRIAIIYHDFLFDDRENSLFQIPINKITFAELTKYNRVTRQKRKNLNLQQLNTFLDDNICSLGDVFSLAPAELAFMIEIKYPLYEERSASGIESTVDINEYVDIILKCVFTNNAHHDQNRYILFASFHPDICIATALKQPHFAVLFLTESGKSFYYDVRCRSLKNALHFAKRHSLFGVVTDVQIIKEAPHLIHIAHENGLILLTYGQENNDENVIDLQMKHACDGLITDHVQFVRQHLNANSNNRRIETIFSSI